MTLEVEPEEPAEPEPALSPWDRRVLRAMATQQQARTGVIALRVLAVVIAAVAIVGSYLYVLEFNSNDDGNIIRRNVPDRQQFAQFLLQIASPLAFAGLVFAASYLLAVYAARLDLDIVLSDDDEAKRSPEPGRDA